MDVSTRAGMSCMYSVARWQSLFVPLRIHQSARANSGAL